jgi:anti-sigma factor RsiW
MNVTRDVVKDLLTVYLADEASADTRALVEEWLRSDPDLAADVDRARRNGLPPVEAPAPTIERRALDRTRRYLRARAIVMGAAIYFSVLPLTITFGSDGFHGLLITDWPSRVVALSVAAVLWVIYYRMSRRLSVSGG